jgi:iron complex outermembrane recepter protein
VQRGHYAFGDSKMRNTTLRSRLMLGVTFCAAALAAPAFAQTQPGQGEDAETIIITGSRIARPDIEASTPVTVLSSEALAVTGQQNVSDILSKLPSVGVGIGRTNTNFATSGNGVAAVNLRNLGESRTLVLVNGRRFVAGLGGSSAVDLNNIPTDFIDNVQVLTGGASAVYGSDAISGVVNFIMKRNFTGLQVRGQATTSGVGDADRYMASITGGLDLGGKGNVMLNVTYDNDEGLRSNRREISREDRPSRSSFASQGLFSVDGNFLSQNAAAGFGVTPLTYTFDAANSLKLFQGNAIDGYNRNGDRFIAVPLERVVASLIMNYDLTDSLRLIIEGTYSHASSRSRLEPQAIDNFDLGISGIPITNPFIPTTIRNAMIAEGVNVLEFRRRSNDIFDRSNVNARNTYRFVLGVEGDIGERWKWEVNYNYGKSEDSTQSETLLAPLYANALDAIRLPSGQIVCADPAARATGCVPINIFGRNTASSEAALYVQGASRPEGRALFTYDAQIEQQVVSAGLVGDLFTLPAGALKVAAGVDHRREKSSETYDDDTTAGTTVGNFLSNTVGSYNVTEGFVEGVAPILRDVPFFQYLGIEGAIRYADYSIPQVGGVWSWKLGGEWAPVEDLRFRAVYSEATRAPNIGELFSSANETFPSGIQDPCDGVTATTTGATATLCRAIPGVRNRITQFGVFQYTIADYQSINGFTGGNQNLEEEKAQTWTIGGVLTPRFVPGMSLTVDWFRIKVANAIGTIPEQTSVNECLGTNDPVFCNNVRRDPARGFITRIDTQNINTASYLTSGIDVGFRYRTDLDAIGVPGAIDLDVKWTHLLKLELTPFPGAAVEQNLGQLDGVGRLGAGFKDRVNASATYKLDGFSFNWRVSYMSAIKDTLDPANAPADNINNVGARFYHDMQVRYAIDEERQYEIYVGVDNVMDTKPPLLPSVITASNVTGTETAADTYDPFGRMIYAGAVIKF